MTIYCNKLCEYSLLLLSENTLLNCTHTLREGMRRCRADVVRFAEVTDIGLSCNIIDLLMICQKKSQN